ncbi:MAG: GTP cyclohydrolase II RibA [Gemmatimonadales bacterium]|nr:MAG: GTP cyclohydrolase II RibA [Gemmatimonadales bacterium]
MRQADRGLYELRRGRPLLLVSRRPGTPDGDGSAGTARLVAGVEGLLPSTLTTLRELGEGPLRLSVTRHRARAMGLTAPEGATSWVLPDNPDPASILATAARPGKPDVLPRTLPADPLEEAALQLVRVGRFLPAVVTTGVGPRSPDAALALALASGKVLQVAASEVSELAADTTLELDSVSEAPVPLAGVESARFHLFREERGLLEHLAIVVGAPDPSRGPVPVRIHSACLTGDLFGSLRCDCGEQLRRSLRLFEEAGGGILCYLCQEGRSIGLGNKLRAYRMQEEEGLDTVDADCTLGFGADERDFEPAVQMLRHLGVGRVALLTNNPAKVRALADGGLEVERRQGVHGTLNIHNLPYLSAKARRAGHLLDEVMSDPLPGGRVLRNGSVKRRNGRMGPFPLQEG